MLDASYFNTGIFALLKIYTVEINIDNNSGFCFGVVNAIETAEKYLETTDQLYCLGDIVHNNMEVERLERKGLKTITHEDFKDLKNATVLLRAHGEPPSTYKIAMENNIKLIDASCPVVLRLQNNVFNGQKEMDQVEGQVVIYGKKGHAEVLGLVGQTAQKAIIVGSDEDLDLIDYNRPINLFSQTTKGTEGFKNLIESINKRLQDNGLQTQFIVHDTLCGQVSNRAPQMRVFASEHDIVIFVSGQKSSNGKYLYGVCKEINPNSHFVSSPEELDRNWFSSSNQKIGVCGATSTPMWLMEDVKKSIENFEVK